MMTSVITLATLFTVCVFIPFVNFIVVTAYTYPLFALSQFILRPDLIDRSYATILPRGEGWFFALAIWTVVGLGVGLLLYVIRFFIYRHKGFPVPPLGLNGFVTIVAIHMLVCLISFGQFLAQ